MGFAVPRLQDWNHELWIVEVEIVSPPYAIDFASAYLDTPPDFPDEILEEKERELEEIFESDWPQVELLRSAFRRYGIHLCDLNPRNICVR